MIVLREPNKARSMGMSPHFVLSLQSQSLNSEGSSREQRCGEGNRVSAFLPSLAFFAQPFSTKVWGEDKAWLV